MIEELKAGLVPPGVEVLFGIEEFDGLAGVWRHEIHARIDGHTVVVNYTTPRDVGDENRPHGVWIMEGYLDDDGEFSDWVASQLREGNTPPGVEVCGRIDAKRLYVVLPGIPGVQELEV